MSMKNYDTLRKLCEKNSRISTKVVDEFLIDYAARHHGLEGKMSKLFKRYSHVTGKLDKGGVAMMMSQFIAHRIFKEEGLIKKFLSHPALGRFNKEEIDYLLQQADQPWRFSFSVITGEPDIDFFLMEDIFSGEEFLLFSPSVSQMKTSGDPILWFNLIGFNGSCWQSFGPIGAYSSFQPDDIYFFATELNPDIENEDEVMENIEKNPVPYMMLLSGSKYPLTFHKEEQLAYLMSEYDLDSCNTAALKKEFVTEYDSGVYRFTPQKWKAHPHLAQAFYDENLKIMLFTAMTDRGFRALVNAINSCGYRFSDEPFLRVNISMLTTVQDILKKKVVLNEYEDLFQVESTREEKDAVDNLNAFMALVLPELNAGRTPNIDAAARKTGVNIKTAHDMVKMVMDKTSKDFGEDTNQDQKYNQGSAEEFNQEEDHTAVLYRKIYLLAAEIRKLSPWKWMYESDLFGVKIPGTDRVYFISIMGSEEAFFALSAYKGYQGLSQFLEFQENVDFLPPETILTIPHLMMSFVDREELSGEHLASIKESGVTFRGRGNWPHLEDFEPAYTPVLPEGETLSDIPILLGQVVEVIRRAEKDTGFLLRDHEIYDDILVRTPSETPEATTWKDVYESFDAKRDSRKFKLTYRNDTQKNVSQLPEAEAVLQMDLVLLPAPVMETAKRGFFPFALLLVDKGRGVVPAMQTLSPEPNLHAMYESVPQKVLEELAKLKYRPTRIEIRSELLYSLVNNSLKGAKVKLRQVKGMPQMDEFIASLVSHLDGGGQ